MRFFRDPRDAAVGQIVAYDVGLIQGVVSQAATQLGPTRHPAGLYPQFVDAVTPLGPRTLAWAVDQLPTDVPPYVPGTPFQNHLDALADQLAHLLNTRFGHRLVAVAPGMHLNLLALRVIEVLPGPFGQRVYFTMDPAHRLRGVPVTDDLLELLAAHEVIDLLDLRPAAV